jgi:hypothetical protein
MALLKPIALIQPRALDFPYRYWNLSPTGPHSCLLVLAGARLEIELEIVGGEVRLLSPLHPVLEPFRTFMPPGLLLTVANDSDSYSIEYDVNYSFCYV